MAAFKLTGEYKVEAHFDGTALLFLRISPSADREFQSVVEAWPYRSPRVAYMTVLDEDLALTVRPTIPDDAIDEPAEFERSVDSVLRWLEDPDTGHGAFAEMVTAYEAAQERRRTLDASASKALARWDRARGSGI